jgi:Flp pilus assembly protein protease CpaA
MASARCTVAAETEAVLTAFLLHQTVETVHIIGLLLHRAEATMLMKRVKATSEIPRCRALRAGG